MATPLEIREQLKVSILILLLTKCIPTDQAFQQIYKKFKSAAAVILNRYALISHFANTGLSSGLHYFFVA